MIKQFQSKEFLKFLLVGGIAAIANFLSRILFSVYTNLFIAVTFAYLTGMVIAYCLNKLFVFNDNIMSLDSINVEKNDFILIKLNVSMYNNPWSLIIIFSLAKVRLTNARRSPCLNWPS